MSQSEQSTITVPRMIKYWYGCKYDLNVRPNPYKDGNLSLGLWITRPKKSLQESILGRD